MPVNVELDGERRPVAVVLEGGSRQPGVASEPEEQPALAPAPARMPDAARSVPEKLHK